MAATLEPFATQVVHLDGSLTLRLAGDLDFATASMLRQVAADLVAAPLRAVTIDMGPLTFVDSAGLRAIAGVIRAAKTIGADVQVLHVTPFVQRIMQVLDAQDLLGAIAPSDPTGTP